MKNLGFNITTAAVGVLAVATIASQGMRANNSDDQGALRASAKLSTFNEVLPKGTGDSGTFRAKRPR